MSGLAEQDAQRRTNKQRRCKNAANRAGADNQRGRHHLEQHDGQHIPPQPIDVQKGVDHTVAIAPDLRRLHGNQTHQQTAHTQADRQRQGGTLKLLPGKLQQPQKLRRQHTCNQSQQHE